MNKAKKADLKEMLDILDNDKNSSIILCYENQEYVLDAPKDVALTYMMFVENELQKIYPTSYISFAESEPSKYNKRKDGRACKAWFMDELEIAGINKSGKNWLPLVYRDDKEIIHIVTYEKNDNKSYLAKLLHIEKFMWKKAPDARLYYKTTKKVYRSTVFDDGIDDTRYGLNYLSSSFIDGIA